MAAMAGLGEFPDLVRGTFVNHEKNNAGIYGVRFYIRGKPWVVSVDDIHLFRYPTLNPAYLVFARQSQDNNAIWGSVLEKAWAKVKGNYLNANGDLVKNGLRALTGIPVFSYPTSEINSTAELDIAFARLKAADDAG